MPDSETAWMRGCGPALTEANQPTASRATITSSVLLLQIVFRNSDRGLIYWTRAEKHSSTVGLDL